MQSLLLRLSALDAIASNAVRVIGFFDELMARRVDVPTLVREASRLAECPVGVAPNGSPVPSHAAARRLADGTVVWLGRPAPGLPLDEILLERLSIAAAVLLDHTSAPPTGLGDAALVELALSAAAGDAERSRALHLLDIRPQAALTVLALAGSAEQAKRTAAALTGHTAELGHLHAVLTVQPLRAADGLLPDIPTDDTRAGISAALPAIDAPTAWRQARTAIRFAGTALPAVAFDDLGALSVLAERLRPEDIASVPDVAALDRIAAQPGGHAVIEVLTAYCANESVRKAATAVHRHHSTVAAHLAQTEACLGFPLTTPHGRRRLDLALLLRHLRTTR